MQASLISIIVPIYNVEKYLNKCVDSIINQTYKNIEIILVDDGSPDNCGAICDEYAKKDDRVKVIHKENGGLSDARNVGIDVASGDYIAFIDSDDYIATDMIEILYKRVVNDSSDMVICNFLYVDEHGESILEMNKDMPIKDEVIFGEEALRRFSEDKGWYYVTATNKLYRKQLFSETRFPVGKSHEDEFTAHHLCGDCDRISCVGQSLYYYVQREGSIMNQKYSAKRLDSTEALLDRANYFFDNSANELAIKTLSKCIDEMIIGMDNIYSDRVNIKNKLIELKKGLAETYFEKISLILKNASLKDLIKISIFTLSFKVGKVIMKTYGKIKF